MRTIRVELEFGNEAGVTRTTEVIVEEGEERDAGLEASIALRQFAEGYDEGNAPHA